MDTRYMKLFLWTHHAIYKKGDNVEQKGMGIAQKEVSHQYYHGKTGRVNNVPSMLLAFS